jgi:hypothetical protein
MWYFCVSREELSLVDTFTFQLLVHFVESLGMAHSDEKSLGKLGLQLFMSGTQRYDVIYRFHTLK